MTCLPRPIGTIAFVSLLGLTCLALTGCGDRGENRLDSRSKQTSDRSELATAPDSDSAPPRLPAPPRDDAELPAVRTEADHLDDSLMDGQAAVCVTSSPRLSADDPLADGWTTEAFSSTADGVLKKLGQKLLSGQPLDAQQLSTWVTDGFSGSGLRPTRHVAYQDDVVVVRRAEASQLPEAHEFQAAAGLAEMLNELGSWSAWSEDAHFKFKIFRVDTSSRPAATDTYFQFYARRAASTVQITATWRCLWEDVSEHPRLVGLEVLAHEEVEAQLGQGLWFADCTEAVLDGPVFREQLLPGVDSWLGTIESRHGIDIGGWQGVAIADVNNDGLEDLYVSQPGGLPNRLYVQNEDGTCRETSQAAGVDWCDSTHAALFVDLDNDGDQDLAVALAAGIMIMANDGRGHFEPAVGKILPSGYPYSLAAADYDQDGDLDIYVCCYNPRSGLNRHVLFARPVPYHDANNGSRNVLLRNDISSSTASWQFSYVTKQVGLSEHNTRFSYAVAWEDYDNDGDLDLYVANDFGRNSLYRNENGRFKDVAAAAGVEDISPGMSACWGDYDNDGHMDLYVSNMFSSAGNRITFQSRFLDEADDTTRAEFQRHARGNSLFRNRGDGTFEDVSLDAAVTLGRWAWGSRFADINNDGWDDLLVMNGFITQGDTGDL